MENESSCLLEDAEVMRSNVKTAPTFTQELDEPVPILFD